MPGGTQAGRRPNLLVIVSDEHAAGAAGCYGHPQVQTPHLDRLAAGGTLFESAHCNSPMCVPSRLSLFSGRYVHQIGAWDNGVIPGAAFTTWGHYLGTAGYETVLCGRTHWNGPDRRHGFERRLVDDLPSWNDTSGRPPRRDAEWRRGSNSHVTECGPGDDPYTGYDLRVIRAAERFLEAKAAGGVAAHIGDAGASGDSDDAGAMRDVGAAGSSGERPWLLYCGLMRPHFPLLAPAEYLARYDSTPIELPATRHDAIDGQHPAIRHLRWSFRNDQPLPEDLVRLATASYWSLVTLVDDLVGRLLRVIDRSALHRNTVVLYTTDHGEMAGHHGIWQKQCFYEPAVRVPLLLRMPEGLRARLPRRVTENVSLVDVLPTLLDLAGAEIPPDLPGQSLLAVACQGAGAPPRAVLSEYHAQGMLTGGFMLKRGDLKYCHYVGHAPQLFDIRADPLECRDLAGDPAYSRVMHELASELRHIVDPEAVDARARADQEARRLRGRPRAGEQELMPKIRSVR